MQGEDYLEISEVVKIEHFTTDAHKAIWQVLKYQEEKGRALLPELVAVELTKINREYVDLLKLVLGKTPMPALKILAVELIEWNNKRELYKVSLQIQENLKEGISSSSIIQVMDESTISLDVGIGTRAKNYLEWEEEIAKAPLLPIFATSVSFLDECLKGGMRAGQLILLMGDPEAGKTVLLTQILRNIATNGHLVMFFSFEFTVRDFIEQNEDKKRKFNKENLFIVNDGYDLSDVSREVKIWAKRGCRFVGIDSQMRVENANNRGTAEQVESEKFNKLAKLCHQLEITIVLICQQGKDDTKGGTHSPMGSKKGAHEASQIWYLHKPKPKHDEDGNDINKEIREFEVSKNKQNGRHFKTEIRLDTRLLEFVRGYKKKSNDSSPVVTEFNPPDSYTDGKGGKKIPVHIEKNLFKKEKKDVVIDIPNIL